MAGVTSEYLYYRSDERLVDKHPMIDEVIAGWKRVKAMSDAN